jgi:SAM-dependent methyltransferase
MKTAKEHYDTHLSAVYDWMTGGFENGVERSRVFFRQLEIENIPRGLAVDLGAGSGFQTIPLAELGFNVLAIDFSADLLKSLESRKGNFPIQTIQDNILNFSNYIENEKASLIVCMGDTLTHMQSLTDVQKLLADTANSLNDKGILILTFRDYFSSELKETQRFIPVRNDGTRIFTCFLEYFENHIEVHDLLYTKVDSGWSFSASSYPKLRLNPQMIVEELKRLEFSSVRNEFENGLVKIVAERSF